MSVEQGCRLPPRTVLDRTGASRLAPVSSAANESFANIHETGTRNGYADEGDAVSGHGAGMVTQVRAARSEWTKLHSLRSTRTDDRLPTPVRDHPRLAYKPQENHHHPPLELALAGVNISQLAIAVLGVLRITGGYSTAMIRATFVAVPKRLPVLWAKLAPSLNERCASRLTIPATRRGAW